MVPVQNPADPQNTNDTSAEHGEQDADDEAAEDTDDTRCVLVIWLFVLKCHRCECVGAWEELIVPPTGNGHNNTSFCKV